MEKLEIAELIKIADILEKDNLLVPLLDMNNRGQLPHFLELIGKKDLLNKIIADRNNKKTK